MTTLSSVPRSFSTTRPWVRPTGEILEPGATRDAEALVAAFLGWPSTEQAFLGRTGIGSIAIDAGS